MAVTLERAKQHLNVDFTDDDDIIGLYMEAAEAWALKYCNRSDIPSGAEAQFDCATLLMLGDLYENREISTATYVENPAARRLIDPFRLLRV